MTSRDLREEIIDSLWSKRFNSEFKEIASRHKVSKEYVLRYGFEIAEHEIIPNYKRYRTAV